MQVGRADFRLPDRRLAGFLNLLPVPAVFTLDPACSSVERNAEFASTFSTVTSLAPLEALLGRAMAQESALRDVPVDVPGFDGTTVHLTASVMALHALDSGPAGAVAFVHDFTQQRRKELDAEQRYRVMADAVPLFVWTARPDGYAEFFNGRWFEYTGHEVDESYGWGWLDAVHPGDRERSARAWAEAAEHGGIYQLDHRLRARDGTHRWHLTRALPLRDESGAIVRWFGSTVDIDDRKRNENGMRLVAAASELLGSALDVHGSFEALGRLATAEFAEICAIFVTDERGAFGPETLVHQRAGVEPRLRELAESISAGERIALEAALRAPGVAVYETLGAARGEPVRRLVRSLDIGCVMVVPLVARGFTFGAIAFAASASDRRFDEADIHVATMLAGRIATALDTARLFQSERRSMRRLRFLAEAGRRIAASLDLRATIETVVRVVVPEFADWAFIAVPAPDGTLLPAAGHHADQTKRATMERFLENIRLSATPEKGTARVMRTGVAETFDGASEAELKARMHQYGLSDAHVALIHDLGFTGAAYVPLIYGGTTRGVIVAVWGSSNRTYSEGDVALFEEIARRAAIAIEHAENFEREHRASELLQRALLPASLPDLPEVRFDAIYEPSLSEAQIGGDWYDAFALPDGRVVVSIGDVTGRGLEAATIMGRMRQVFNTLSLTLTDPAQMLDAADTVLRRMYSEAIVTALVGILDPKRRTFAYATAGHPPPYLRAPGGHVVRLPCHGLPLGLRQEQEPPTTTVGLPDDAAIVLYTDGLTESTRDVIEGERRLIGALHDPRVFESERPALALKNAVLSDGGSDDIAILTVAVSGMPKQAETETPLAAEWSMHWSFDAREARVSHEVRRDYLEYLRAQGAHDADYVAAELVFGELIGNVVKHAPGPVEIELNWSGAKPVLHVLDRGPGFERKGDLPSDPLSESGRGLFLLNLLTDEFTVTRLPGYGSHARAVLPVHRAA